MKSGGTTSIMNATTPLSGRSSGFGWARNPDDMVAASAAGGDSTSTSGTGQHVLQRVMEVLDMGESEVSNRTVLSWLLIRACGKRKMMLLDEFMTGEAECWEKL